MHPYLSMKPYFSMKPYHKLVSNTVVANTNLGGQRGQPTESTTDVVYSLATTDGPKCNQGLHLTGLNITS